MMPFGEAGSYALGETIIVAFPLLLNRENRLQTAGT
jgi:hypothetical protein